jgi:protein required for attachment to host cells
MHLRLKHDTWVLVADGAKALFLRNEGDEQFPNLQTIEVHKTGNASDNKGGPSPSDTQRVAEDRFAKETAEALNQAALAHRFDRLVVVAPPKALAELRANFHKEVQNRIVAEVDKTLTSHPVPEIERVLTGAGEK